MDSVFHTLHDFLYFTKGMVYVLMGLMLVCLLAFWGFLTGRDDEE